MGMYWGVKNYTKKHNVCGYWKGSPPSIHEIQEMIIRYSWDDTDYILVQCYCKGYRYKDSKYIELDDNDKDDECDDKEKAEWKGFNFYNPDAEFDGAYFCN